MKVIIFLSLFVLSHIFTANSGQIIVKIADKIITQNDVDDRISVMKTLDPNNNFANLQKDILSQIALQQLINDKIVLIDCKRSKIEIEKKELDNAIEFIETQIGVQKGKLEQYCKDHGVNFAHLVEHIKSQTALYKLVGIKIRPKVQIDDETIFRLVGNYNVINFTGILFTINNDNSAKAIKKLLHNTKICSDIDNFKVDQDIKYEKYINKVLTELPKEYATLAFETKSNNFSNQLKQDKETNIMLVCKKELNLSEPEKQKIKQAVTNTILSQKTEVYMQKLHKELMVEHLNKGH